jgi:hypothetical protein
MIYFSDSVAQCNIWRQNFFFQLLLATKYQIFKNIYTVKIVFLWYTETVFSWYIQSLVPKCTFFISLSNGNTFRSFTIPKRKWYLWIEPEKMHCLSLKMGDFPKNEDFVWHLGEISNWTNWHNFGRKIMSIWYMYIFQIQLLDSLYSLYLEQYWFISDNNFHVFHVHCEGGIKVEYKYTSAKWHHFAIIHIIKLKIIAEG